MRLTMFVRRTVKIPSPRTSSSNTQHSPTTGVPAQITGMCSLSRRSVTAIGGGNLSPSPTYRTKLPDPKTLAQHLDKLRTTKAHGPA